MFGQILYGAAQYADTKFGVFAAEITSNISNSTAPMAIRAQGTLSTFPSSNPRIPELDIDIDVKREEEDFVPKLSVVAYGNFDEFGKELLSQLGIGAYSTFKVGKTISDALGSLGLGAYGYFYRVHPNDNSISWSNIGSLDFTVQQDNIAGSAPLNFKGYVYAIEQLAGGNKIILYSVNGIAIIIPQGTSMGITQVMGVGIKSKHARVNTLAEQYFITANNHMYQINSSGQFNKLGYSEFFSNMSSVVMSYDNKNELIYICDGTYGYVYSIEDGSLTTGPNNVTGISYRDDTSYIVSPSAITNPNFSLVSGIYDLGTRKEKTVFEIEFGTSYTGSLVAAVDYRIKGVESFSSTPWVQVNPNGIAEIPCYGLEFRFKIKSTSLASFTIDWIKVNGVIHGFSFLDTIRKE